MLAAGIKELCNIGGFLKSGTWQVFKRESFWFRNYHSVSMSSSSCFGVLFFILCFYSLEKILLQLAASFTHPKSILKYHQGTLLTKHFCRTKLTISFIYADITSSSSQHCTSVFAGQLQFHCGTIQRIHSQSCGVARDWSGQELYHGEYIQWLWSGTL